MTEPGAGAPRTLRLRTGRSLLLALWIAAALPLPLAPPAAAQAADPLAARREQIQQIRGEREQMERRLEAFKLSEKEALEDIEQHSAAVKASHSRKRAIEEELARATAQRRAQDRELAALNAQMRQLQQRIAARLRRLYRMSKAEASASLLQLARFKTFARDAHVVTRIQQGDQQAVHQFQALAGAALQRQGELRSTLAHLESLRSELDAESRVFSEREEGLRATLENMRKNQELYARYLGDLETARTGVEAALRKMEQSPSAPPRDAAADSGRLRGKLPPPAPGKVIATFGQQDPRYQLKKFQRGIVLRVAQAAPVRAVAGGTVVHAGPFRGYQDLVVLDHGQGLYTVYGHLEKAAPDKGAWADAGSILGQATYQPEDQAYNVYFEIRVNGRPEDPLQWLDRAKLKAGG
jgi:septal ring factor EnvC (AmiA/AmiB activator)